MVQQNSEFLEVMSAVVDKYINQCGRRWVEMGSIFSFMNSVKK